jgi:hypothetical protein
MGCRGVLLLLVLGGVLFGYGFSEWQVSRNASATPEPITVEALEKGPPTNPYRVLGEHLVLYPGVVYYKQKDEIQYVYYPITTRDRVMEAVRKMASRHGGDPRKVSDDEVLAGLDVRVVIKTRRYRTVDDLQQAIRKESFPTKDVPGMVVNSIASVGAREAELIRSSIKSFDPARVIIFEADRTPSSIAFAFAMMGGGVVLSLSALFGGLLGRRRASARAG